MEFRRLPPVSTFTWKQIIISMLRSIENEAAMWVNKWSEAGRMPCAPT